MSLSNGKKVKVPRWLIVIAIIAVVFIFFISVWYYAIHVLMGLGRKSVSGSNLCTIADSYTAYSLYPEAGRRMLSAHPGDTAHAAALILACDVNFHGGLNDASLWLIESEPALAGKVLPKTVLVGDPKNGVLNPDFARLTLAYDFAANIPPDAPGETTPIAWTRGLQPDGTWSKDSPWQGKGGHVVFLSGSVEWHEKLSLKKDDHDYAEPLVKYGTTTTTLDIREALPPGAIILPAEPAVKTP